MSQQQSTKHCVKSFGGFDKEAPQAAKILNFGAVEFEISAPKALFCGNRTTFVITESNQVFGCGENRNGQLGIGNKMNCAEFINIHFPPTQIIKKISSGTYNTLALTEQGQVYAFGLNKQGQCGTSVTSANLLVPTLIETLNNVIDIACGANHSLVLTSQNEVYAFGSNVYGQCGVGDEQAKYIAQPTLVPTSFKVTQICCGLNHSMLLTENGMLYSFGDGFYGQTAHEDCKVRHQPALVPFFKVKQLPIAKVWCGGHHTIVITSEKKEIYGFGLNRYAQLAIPPEEQIYDPVNVYLTDRVIMDFLCGEYHTFCMVDRSKSVKAASKQSQKVDMEIHSFGSNENGQCCHSDYESIDIATLPSPSPTLIATGYDHTVMIFSTTAPAESHSKPATATPSSKEKEQKAESKPKSSFYYTKPTSG